MGLDIQGPVSEIPYPGYYNLTGLKKWSNSYSYKLDGVDFHNY